MEAAAEYLNTPLTGEAAQELAQQLFTVLARRLPARLLALSDSPEGSLTTLKADKDLIGTVASADGNVDILVERVARSGTQSLWLFSNETLGEIPDLFAELNQIRVDTAVPPFLLKHRIAGVALFNWLGAFVGMPVIYLAMSLLDRCLGLLVGSLRRRTKANTPNPEILPRPVRLLLIALAIDGLVSKAALPLLARQFWATTTTFITIVACIWLAIFFNQRTESYILRRLARTGNIGASSVVHLSRKAVDLLAFCSGLLILLYEFGLKPATFLAGLGIGGIAIALAARETLENVFGGISIIFDRPVRVGDVLTVDDTTGTVEQVGLRSTRIRTRDRSVVSIPNGQLANLSLENLSSRDKFWFHPTVRLGFDTTAAQMRSILSGLRDVLTHDSRIEPDSVQVRLLEFGTFSFHVEVLAYVWATDANAFVEIQGELLLRFMETVQATGAQIASQSFLIVAPTSGAPGEPPKSANA